jgi:hypothetical protein
MFFLTLALNLALAHAAPPIFNYTTCPAYYELQTQQVKEGFSLDRFAGSYYELALHDWTQRPACPKPTCIQAQKVINRTIYDSNPILVEDHWSLECFGERFRPLLLFNYTKHRGFMEGFTTLIPGTVFPNTIVDFQYNKTCDCYDWVIEFQCLTKLDHVFFVGLNFYVREPHLSPEAFDALLNAGRAQGLGIYMDKKKAHSGAGLYNVSQTNCSYDPPPNASSA